MTIDAHMLRIRPRRRSRAIREDISRLERTLLGVAGVVSVLILWQVLAGTHVINPLIVSSPVDIANAAKELAVSGELWRAVVSSAGLYATGFGISLGVGLVLGLLLGWYRRFEAVMDPIVSMLYATPHLALLPLITIWFGIGFKAQVAMVILVSIFPIIINTATGVSTIDREHIRVARSLLATNLDVLRTIALPGAIPAIVSGIRQGLVLALIGVVVSEYFFGNTGLGGLIFTQSLSLDTASAYVGVLIFALTALLLTSVLRILQRRLDKWRA